MFWIRRKKPQQLPRWEPWPSFAARYGGTEDSCADAYLDGLMKDADKADYEERFFVANRMLMRLLLRLKVTPRG